jgi:hypothetical protein
MKAAPTSRKGKAAPAGLRGVDLIARAVAPSPESKAPPPAPPSAPRDEDPSTAELREALAAQAKTELMRARILAADEAELDKIHLSAVRDALKNRETKRNALVENRGKTFYKPDMDGLHNYLKSRGVPESLQPKLAAKLDALVTAEITGREAAPAAALEAMTLKDRRAALIEHYGLLPDKDGNYTLPEKKQWKNVRGENPTPEQFRAWLDAVFPDRQAIGMVLSDLKHLAPDAYGKLHTWANKKPAKATSESFGLPSKRTSYDPARDSNEVIARVEFKKLQRSLRRAQYHASLG